MFIQGGFDMFIQGGFDIFTDVCCCRMDKFDKARKSHGTDEDVLLVYTQGEIVGL